MRCRSVCEGIEGSSRRARYRLGYYWCSECSIALHRSSCELRNGAVVCPCCGNRVRTTPRTRRGWKAW
ncbi:MAG: hypothetical protein QXO17_03090 [Nitrososphaerota archaeon]|nr:hypothetical protein [Candidatus Calditenuis fumarioli]